MTGHRPFETLTKGLPAARKARIADKMATLLRALEIAARFPDGAVTIAPEEKATDKKK